MTYGKFMFAVVVGAALVSVSGCGDSDSGGGTSGTGGTAGSGGSSGSGSGATGGSGGSTGGTTSTGGTAGSGGGAGASGGSAGAAGYDCTAYCACMTAQCASTAFPNGMTCDAFCQSAVSQSVLDCWVKHCGFVASGQSATTHCPHTIGTMGQCPNQ